jgi:MYXO-CTERM domain-containing protein
MRRRTAHEPVTTTAPSRPSAAATLAAGALALLVGAPGLAHAHGREPAIGQVAFDATDRDHFLLRGTWALMTTRDGGESFTWTCAVAADFDRLTEDPPALVTESGRVVLGTFDGLRLSSTEGCDYTDAAAPAWGAFAIDVQPDPNDARTFYVAMSPGDRANTLLRSRDEGGSFEVLHTFDFGLLLERVRLSPSDPMRMYVTGAVPRMGMEPRRVFFHRSSDGGETFTAIEIPLLEGERNAHVLAVDPMNADRALVRMTRAVTDETPERLLLTEDGGDTFRTVLEIREIIALAFAHDGSRVWAGSWQGGLYRSDDAGETFAPIDPDLRMRCLAERESESGESELFVCVDELTNDYAVGRSLDGGDTITPVWGFADVVNDTGCSACTVVGAVCPSYWPDVLYDIATIGGVDGGPAPGPTDVGTVMCGEGGVPFDARLGGSDAASLPEPPATTGCACRAGASPRGHLGLVTLAMLALAVIRRRR